MADMAASVLAKLKNKAKVSGICTVSEHYVKVVIQIPENMIV